MDVTVLLFTAILAFVMGNFLMYGIKTMSWMFWRTSLDGLVEEETPEGISTLTMQSIGVGTDLTMDEIMMVSDHIREVNRMDMEIENYRREIVKIQQTSVPRQSFEAMRIHCEAEKAEMIRTCRRELREITQNPVYFTRSGRVWHSDPRCPSRFTDQSIQSRGYCTLCAHFLGREVPEHEFEAGGPVTEAPLVWFFLHQPLFHRCELSATQLCIQPFHLLPFSPWAQISRELTA